MAAEKVGAGLLLSCEGQVLLLLRAGRHNSNTWGLPGGNAEDGDADLLATARREATEEMGPLPAFSVLGGPILTTRGKRGQKHYTVFLGALDPAVKASWAPQLNGEHTAWRWFPVAEACQCPELHPVVSLVLQQDPPRTTVLAAVGAASSSGGSKDAAAGGAEAGQPAAVAGAEAPMGQQQQQAAGRAEDGERAGGTGHCCALS